MQKDRIKRKREMLGISAVKYLQSYAGVDETVVTALHKWRGLDAHQQGRVIDAYFALKGDQHERHV